MKLRNLHDKEMVSTVVYRMIAEDNNTIEMTMAQRKKYIEDTKKRLLLELNSGRAVFTAKYKKYLYDISVNLGG